MKVVSPEERQEHYAATMKGGWIGGLSGLSVGIAGVTLAARRYPAFKRMNTPFHGFIAGSCGIIASILTADHYSHAYELEKHPERAYKSRAWAEWKEAEDKKPRGEQIKDWARHNRYKIIGGSWAASMLGSWALVNRDRFLTGQQKLVQARVYAQGITVAVLLASLLLEASDKHQEKGRWETVMVVDPDDPKQQHMIEKQIHEERYDGEDQWRLAMEQEEERMKERHERLRTKKGHEKEQKEEDKDGNKEEQKQEDKDGSKEEQKDSKDKPEKEAKDSS